MLSVHLKSRTFWIKLGILLAVIGVGFSMYSIALHLSVHEKGATDAYCNINKQFNCDRVELSDFSEFLKIPLGVYGASFFIALIALLAVSLWSQKKNEYMAGLGVLTLLGVLACCVLFGISTFILNTFCINCLLIYVLTFSEFFIWYNLTDKPFHSLRNTKQVATTCFFTLVLLVGAIFSFLLVKKNNKLSSEMPANAAELLWDNQTHEIPLTKSSFDESGEDYRFGNDHAQIVVVEYADFQCPACKRASEIVEGLKDEFADKVLFVFKNYPLDQSCNSQIPAPMHRYACEAATYARCAGIQGKFWEYHNLVFSRQDEINSSKLSEWLQEIGVSEENIKACLADKSLMEKIKQDIALAQKIGLNATPTLYINGKKYLGPRSNLRNILLQMTTENP